MRAWPGWTMQGAPGQSALTPRYAQAGHTRRQIPCQDDFS
jgi:hypothetical protein